MVRSLLLTFVLLGGCMNGCGGDPTEGDEASRGGPVRLPPGTGGEPPEEPTTAVPHDESDLAEPPPVEPPPPLEPTTAESE